MGDFKKLTVWRRAHELAITAYHVTATFPFSERFGLTAQVRRSAVSVSANVAQSCGRWEMRDQVRLLRIAQGSAREFEAQMLLAREVGLVARDRSYEPLDLANDVQRMLAALIRSRLAGTGLNRPPA